MAVSESLTRTDPLAYPVDTHARSASSGRSKEEWCERSDGTKHGPYRRFLDAKLAREGVI